MRSPIAKPATSAPNAATRADVRAHRGNLAALDRHVGLLEVADRTIEAEYAATLDQDRTAGRGRGRLLGLGRADDHREVMWAWVSAHWPTRRKQFPGKEKRYCGLTPASLRSLP